MIRFKKISSIAAVLVVLALPLWAPATSWSQGFKLQIRATTDGFGEHASTSKGAGQEDDEKPKNADATKSSYSSWLSEHGIESSKEGIAKYLETLGSNEALIKKANTLVARLSDEDYVVREKATRDLKNYPGMSIALLKSVDDQLVTTTEGRYRLKSVLEAKEKANTAQVHFTVLREIEASKLMGLCALLVESSSQLDQKTFVLEALAKAIASTALPEDMELLQKTFVECPKNSQLQTGCLAGIAKLDPSAGLRFALKHKEGVKGKFGLSVARILVENEKIESFEVLTGLLKDKDNRIRILALNVIRSSSGLKFENNYLQNEKAIQEALASTSNWLKESNAAKIEYRWATKDVRLGRRLIAHYDKNVVVELDKSNNIVWSTAAKKPFTCLGLPNGHRIVVEYQAGTIIVFDDGGKEINRIKDVSSSMSGICKLPNGNLMMAAGQNDNQLFEMDVKGNKIKTFTVAGTPTSVEVGMNGNLICALYKKHEIVELDGNGKVIKSFKVEGAPYHATPLKNGNYLVAFARDKKVAEFDAAGNEVWKIDCGTGSYRAQEMEDGTIVYADAEGIHHVNRQGEEIKFTDLSVSGKIHYSHSF